MVLGRRRNNNNNGDAPSRDVSPVPADPAPTRLTALEEQKTGWIRAECANLRPAIHRGRAPFVNSPASSDDESETESTSSRASSPDRAGRPLSPSDLPGVRAIPREMNIALRGQLTPGLYFAKSMTRYLGPFENVPTVDDLPAGDRYVILQRMGRLPDTGKSVFRKVQYLDLN